MGFSPVLEIRQRLAVDAGEYLNLYETDTTLAALNLRDERLRFPNEVTDLTLSKPSLDSGGPEPLAQTSVGGAEAICRRRRHHSSLGDHSPRCTLTCATRISTRRAPATSALDVVWKVTLFSAAPAHPFANGSLRRVYHPVMLTARSLLSRLYGKRLIFVCLVLIHRSESPRLKPIWANRFHLSAIKLHEVEKSRGAALQRCPWAVLDDSLSA